MRYSRDRDMSTCTPPFPWSMPEFDSLESCIQAYFSLGCQYAKILKFLEMFHGISISLRHLKYIINTKLRLRRVGNTTATPDILEALSTELKGPSKLIGYRAMTDILQRKYGFTISRHRVMGIMRDIDPIGSLNRRQRRLKRRKYISQGPNYAWHIDGYDKLSKWGFCISAAIDGFSRKIIYLKVGPTNHDPRIIASYYLDAITEFGGCPKRLQTDCGTENVIIATLQEVFSSVDQNNVDAIGSHKYSSSPANQRIECWWSFLRKSRTDWWITTFRQLTESGAFLVGNNLHKWLLQFCMMEILQEDLNFVAYMWNLHRIRPSRMAECVAGIPNELYHLPHVHGVQDHKVPVCKDVLGWAYTKSATTTTTGCEEFETYMVYLMEFFGMQKPNDLMESPMNLSWSSSIESSDCNILTLLSGSSSAKTSTNRNANQFLHETTWLRECKAAYLSIKPTVGDDLLTMAELTRALQQAGLNPSKRSIEMYWPKEAASLSFVHFCDFVELENNTNSVELVAAFQKIDPEKSGFIVYQDLHNLMTMKGEKMTDEEFQEIFEFSPFVKDGKFYYDHFCETITKTAKTCRNVSIETSDNREKESKRNSNTYIIKRKNGLKNVPRHSSNSVSENEHVDLIKMNFMDWPKLQSKGCFYFDVPSDSVLSQQFALDIPESTNVWITIEPLGKNGNATDALLFILKDVDCTPRQLVTFTENRDENGRCFLGTRLEVGKYILLPFTNGHRLRNSKNSGHDSPKCELVENRNHNQVALSTKFRKILEEVFKMADLDGNGRLSRQEFTLLQWRMCGEEVQDDEWAALEATFELESGELTLNGFIDAHLLEAENNLGHSDELWKSLHAIGYNGQLELQRAFPFLMQIYTEEANSELTISAMKAGSVLLEKALCRCVIEKGCASKVRNLNDLILYTYSSNFHAIIAVYNKAHSKVFVRLDCSLSQNCCSHRGTLDFTLECQPNSIMIGHHLVSACDKEPWQVSCIESVVK